MKDTFKKLYYLLDKRTRLQLLSLFGLMVVASILETGGIGLVVPFISIIADPGIIESNRWLSGAKGLLGVDNPRDFLIYMSIGFMAFYFVKNIFLGVMNYLQLRFVFSKRSSLGRKLLSLYLYSPYAFHLERNTAELYRNIGLAAGNIYAFVQSFLRLCTELCVMVGIVVLLILLNPIVFICSIGLLGIIGGIFYKIVHRYSRAWGEILQSSQKKVSQSVLEGLGAIKEVKVFGREDFFSEHYYSSMMKNARAQWMHSTLNIMPAMILEVAAIGSVSVIIILMYAQGRATDALLPMLTLYVMSSIRLMPAVSRIVSALQQFRFYSPAVEIIYEDFYRFNNGDFAKPRPGTAPGQLLEFKKELRVHDLGYEYPESDKKALQGVSLSIRAGQSVAFVGSTGAGKTTLANIILGLLEPSEGEVLADRQNIFDQLGAWHQNIGYVPQSIYLLDASIRCNVAFGIDDKDIDDSRVREALQMAQLEVFVDHLPNGLNTIIGENGVRISGGERQRLGIARALYHRPKILMLDEATSALDNETEEELGRALERLSGEKTLIIIAHRFSTIRKCDCIYFMQNGTVVDSGTFNELYLNNSDFKRIAESGDLGLKNN